MTDKEKLNAIRAEVEKYIDAARKAHTNITEGNFAHLLSFINSLQEEPVSKDLKEAAVEAFKHIVDSDKNSFLEIFKAGAKWKEEQFKKNLLDVCKKQTEEEAEIERDFIEGIIDEHRLPTFDDAIKYGMRLQKEQMMKDAIDTELDDVCGFLTISVPYHNGIAGDKVKVIIIKSE